MPQTKTLGEAFLRNFLGQAPDWFKITILLFLLINPIVFYISPFTAGWLLIIEFIFTLAMALKCYPLQPGGLLALEAVALGMTSPHMVMHEISANIEVLLLLIFMVAGIYFMKELLLFFFTKLLIKIRSKAMLSLAFCFAAAFLSAFLDALTVIAVVIAVATGFYSIYHKVASGKEFHHSHDHTADENLHDLTRDDLEQFRSFLRSLMMHAAVGTALGGVCTLVGEPQNLIIGDRAGWDFVNFAIRVAPISFPTLLFGLATCLLLEKFKVFGYGAKLPDAVRTILSDFEKYSTERRTKRDVANLIVQGIIALWLIVGLALHLADVGLIGLSVIVLATSATGVIEEHQLGKAFEEALPFTALLSVFFAIVAVIIEQDLFAPVTQWVLSFEGHGQLWRVFLANGILSMVSDNVFVGTVYIEEMYAALNNGSISRDQFDLLAVAVNTGTNLPSVATPNGQAAFLFLLTSALAPLLRLSYGRMVWMALPYTIVMLSVSLAATLFILEPATQLLYDTGWIHHIVEPAAAAAAPAH
ncbi:MULTISPECIES: sodium/proton antiporter NhaB [Corallincola]|uniref:Na(+)/H(+) antiporter NhaB n=3 Tax=Corallincola TaxID=1775176 RepID=A0A368NIW9_9GAMM|nr:MULTISPECIES: sodium/proton antiporter NhaB [Corallincola]RCU50388.1 sodium/proton antiporter NhaB [Corallincola holothuriorum]TAA48601.1 sodium/proton antiporter NhaB [Corallincola spongiicola]TCI05540.1 sodium/proton antiporter NhaB [Corallincola luteus]